MEPGSDIDLNLRFGVDDDGARVVSGRPLAGSGSFLAAIDFGRGSYRSFDLGGLEDRANTLANVARIHQWATVHVRGSVTPQALVGALLADVDSDKNALLATSLRNAYSYSAAAADLQQQQTCTQWVNFKLRTSDVVGIKMVETRNDTTVNLIDGHPYMNIGVRCWAYHPTAAGTNWYSSSCQATPVFFLGRSYSRVYHRAWNDDFSEGAFGTHSVKHWIWDNFNHIAGTQWATWDVRSYGQLAGTFITSVRDDRKGDNC